MIAMTDKKDPGKFTVRFNVCDPRHRAVIDLLNRQGRNKAQFLANAVLHYINCAEASEIRMPAVPDKGALEKLILGVLEAHTGRAESSAPALPHQTGREQKREDATPTDGADLEQWFGGQDGMAAILNSLQMFEQN